LAERSSFLAESIGTFALVFAGTGAIIINQLTGALGHVGVAITFGLIIMVMIYSFGHVSGAHFNPAVTLAFAAVGDLPWRRVPLYLGAQLLGAVSASAALRGTFGLVGSLGATVPATLPGHSLVLEFVMTFLLMTVIIASATDARAVKGFAGLAIGGTVGLEAMFGGPVSGASMNPARSFGPALVGGAWEHHWIYWAAPVAGALLAAFLYRRLIQEPALRGGGADGAARR
jgi:aquaporin NIP